MIKGISHKWERGKRHPTKERHKMDIVDTLFYIQTTVFPLSCLQVLCIQSKHQGYGILLLTEAENEKYFWGRSSSSLFWYWEMTSSN